MTYQLRSLCRDCVERKISSSPEWEDDQGVVVEAATFNNIITGVLQYFFAEFTIPLEKQ